MGKEIEFRYFVDHDKIKELLVTRKGDLIIQGYLNLDPERTVRVRIQRDKGFVTVKGPNLTRDDGAKSCLEFEYSIPKHDAQVMLQMCEGYIIQKVRYYIGGDSHLWEVDVFMDAHDGLIIAECEIDPDDEVILPDWVTENISDQVGYYNSSLAKTPYR